MLEEIAEAPQATETHLNNEISSEIETKKGDGKGIDLDRVHIKNIPSYIGFKQFKKLLEKILGNVKSKKVRHMSDYAYVSFESPEDAQKAIKMIDGYEIKKNTLTAQLAATEVKDLRPVTTDNIEPVQQKTAREIATPLADDPYEKQLEMKQAAAVKVMDKMYTQLNQNKVGGLGKQSEFRKRLETILPAPKTKGYRNKCEFTIGHDLNKEICVGFVGGRFAKNQHFVVPPVDVDIVSTQMMAIVADVSEFVKESGLEPFNEFERVGFWRMLTIREFGGDVMLIFTVFPLEDEKKTKEIQNQITDRFLAFTTFEEKKYRVCSVYWQQMVHISDAPNFKLVGGTPYIYESLLDCRFRVSPPAFFQTNSQATCLLYSTIGKLSGLAEEKTEVNKVVPMEAESAPLADEEKEEDRSDEAPPAKISKIEESEQTAPAPKDHGTILLDICCGTGTIGQCLLKPIINKQKVCCVGIEMIPEAIEDAKQNSKQNKMEKHFKYIAGKAEDVFRSMRYHLPSDFDLRKSRVVGVLDPPRAGMHEKVILACREMETMRRLIFVSCDPSAAINNIVQLCRPSSRKYSGDAFSVTRVQPVDMFPQTNHMEWIIQLDR